MSVKNDQSSIRELPNTGGRVCVSYGPGHNVHWIQALHSANHEEVAAKTWAGKVTSVEGEVVVVRKPDSSLVRFRVHDPARLSALLERRGFKVTVNDQYCIMRAGFTRSGSMCISVLADQGKPLGPCKSADQVSNPADVQEEF
jgi:hypothetical protein